MSQEVLCRYFGHSRQGYWKHLKLAGYRAAQGEVVLEIVRQVRVRQPRAGCRKMHEHVNRELLYRGYSPIGRDRFFELLREKDLLVTRYRKTCYTTNSYHRFRKHRNLLKHIIVTGPNQVWVSDITYIRVGSDFSYLFLITDYYSRKIVGYSIRQDLSVQGALIALRMAVRQTGVRGIIHHSDRGVQYCCDQYAAELSKHDLFVSMTEENHCYENSVAERVNETLKYDLMLIEGFRDYKTAVKATREAIKIYNEERWHGSLGYKTPAMVHAA